ncbi:MAG: TolC family protein, partial [bacterium]
QNGKALSLEECIDIALKNNSQLKNAIYQLDRTGANVKSSYSGVLPRITSSFSSGRTTIGKSIDLRSVPVIDPITKQPVIDPETGEQVIDYRENVSPSRSFYGHSLTLRYSQTLYDFGRSWNAIKQAKASFNASTSSLTAARQNVYATVKERYFQLLKAIKLEQEYQLAMERGKEQLERTKSMYEIGSVAQIDVYRSEVTLGNDQVNLINQQNTVQIARWNLNVAMGRDPETPLEIMEVDANSDLPNFTLEEAMAIAEKNNPDLKRYEYDMRSAELGQKIAKNNFWPSIGISASYTRRNEKLNRVYGQFDQNFSLSLGAQLDLNIFNGLTDVADLDRQRSNYAIAQESWLDTKRQTHLKVKQAYLNLKAWDQISKINETNLRAAEEEYRLAQERYRVGAGTQLEVTEAQVSLTRARVVLVRTKYDAMIAQAQLEAAMGVIEEEQ